MAAPLHASGDLDCGSSYRGAGESADGPPDYVPPGAGEMKLAERVLRAIERRNGRATLDHMVRANPGQKKESLRSAANRLVRYGVLGRGGISCPDDYFLLDRAAVDRLRNDADATDGRLAQTGDARGDAASGDESLRTVHSAEITTASTDAGGVSPEPSRQDDDDDYETPPVSVAPDSVELDDGEGADSRAPRTFNRRKTDRRWADRSETGPALTVDEYIAGLLKYVEQARTAAPIQVERKLAVLDSLGPIVNEEIEAVLDEIRVDLARFARFSADSEDR